jgi:membrane protease YdiL (CAAX protease family)
MTIDEDTLQAIDIGVHIVGVVALLAFVTHLFRSGRWRDPLAEHGWAYAGPNLLHVGAVVLVYIATAQILLASVKQDFDVKSMLEPGSRGWHALQSADAAAKLLATALIPVALAARRPFRRERTGRPGVAGTLGITLLAALVLTPLCTVQLQMGDVLWQWVKPEVLPPVHPAMQALHDSEWDWRGPVQLFLLALLVAPVAEELFFRGVLLEAIWTAGRRAWLAIALSALVFGLVHVPQPQTVLPLVTMGLVLGYVRVRYRSLVPCVLAHALFNARTMVMLYVAPDLLTDAQ